MQAQHHRRTGLELLTHESAGFRNRQMDASVINRRNRRNGPRQFALKAALIIDLLNELAGPELLIFEQLKTNKTALRQSLACELEAGVVNDPGRDQNRSTALAVFIGDLHLLQRRHDGRAIFVVEV